jgi:hypothetical protein
MSAGRQGRRPARSSQDLNTTCRKHLGVCNSPQPAGKWGLWFYDRRVQLQPSALAKEFMLLVSAYQNVLAGVRLSSASVKLSTLVEKLS